MTLRGICRTSSGSPHNEPGADLPAHRGALSIDDDDDVREFTFTQRPEVIKLLTPDEKVRMAELAFEGWVADGDVDAIEVLYKNSTPPEKAMIRKAIDPSDLSNADQEARLKAIFTR